MKYAFVLKSLLLFAVVLIAAGCEEGNEGGSVTDADGNKHSSVTIGKQVWMGENLKTTKYNDDTPITYVGDNNTDWLNKTTEAYTWYDANLKREALLKQTDKATKRHLYLPSSKRFGSITGNIKPSKAVAAVRSYIIPRAVE